jgi:hypothetical protein
MEARFTIETSRAADWTPNYDRLQFAYLAKTLFPEQSIFVSPLQKVTASADVRCMEDVVVASAKHFGEGEYRSD